MEDSHPISHKFVWIQESKCHTLLDDLLKIQSSMHTLVVVEDGEVAEQVTQFLDEHGISLPIYDFGHNDPITIQSFQSGEIPILITTVEEECYWDFYSSARNVLVDVPLFTTDQYLDYKQLLATPEGHLTFYVNNDNWLSVAYIHSVPHNLNSLISNYRLFRRPPSAPKITPLTQC